MQARRHGTPLPDHFIDEHLVEMFPLFDQAGLQLVNVMNPAAIHMLLQLPPNLACWEILRWIFALYPFSCLSTLIKTWLSAENTMFIIYAVYVDCVNVTQHHFQTNDCSKQRCIGNRYFVIGIWTLITPLSYNIFSWNLVVFSQIYSKTSAHNSIKIYSDLTFLSHIVTFSWIQCRE